MMHRALGSSLRLACLWAGLVAVGCSSQPKDELKSPTALRAPYDTSKGEVLWAVAPLRNESGTTQVDVLAISDQLAEAVAQVRGLRCLPVNRSLATMRALEMTEIRSPGDAQRLATEMGVDAILVGSITGYDPYNPPKLGISVALIARPGVLNGKVIAPIDPMTLRYQPTDYTPFPRSSYAEGPASSIASFLDAKNHQVQADLRTYAIGREERSSALGWRRFMASMPLYSEFVVWHTVASLIDREWMRLARLESPAASNRQAAQHVNPQDNP